MYDGWFATSVDLVLGAGPRDGWSTPAGQSVVLVVYSSRKLLGVFDKGAFNDELALALAPQELVAGADLSLAGRTARFQQGGTKLQFVSTQLEGRLRIQGFDGHAMQGSFELRASAPSMDVLGVGVAEATGEFAVRRRDP